MKILFVVDNLDNTNDPSINLAQNLKSVISKYHSVQFLGHTTQKQNSDEFCFYFGLDKKVRNLFFSLNGKTISQKIIKLISNFHLSVFGLLKCFNIDIISSVYKKHIQSICKKYDIDAVISISAPFYTAKSIAKSSIKSKKIIVMFDPYAKHHIYGNKITQWQEKHCFKKVDHIFMPQLLKKEYQNSKIVSIEFPSLVFNFPLSPTPLLDNTKTNIVFVGNLYSDIRRPDYLYDLVKSAKNENLHITLVGGIYGYFEPSFSEKYNDFVKQHVTIVGKVDKSTAKSYIAQSDIVVNIGNSIENMLPSKVMECIASGKKVLNLYQTPNCPTLEYFAKYHNSLNLYTKDKITQQTLDSFSNFINSNTNVSKDEILQNFYTSTPEYVAQQILEEIIK